jgi:hypothetical protein
MTIQWRSNTTPEIASVDDPRYETPGGAQNKVDEAYDELLHLLKLAVTGMSDGSEAAIARYSTPYNITYDWLKDRLDASDTRFKNLNVVNVRDYAALGDGTTDDRLAFTNADAVGTTVYVPVGNYLIADNITLNGDYVFQKGAFLTIQSGKTVTINGKIISEEHQIFKGSGAVAGLKEVNLTWFAGDKKNTTTDALTDIQKAYNSCVVSATVYWPIGSFSITGDTPIVVSKGQRTIGQGPFKTELRFNTSVMYGFTFNTTISPEISNMSFSSNMSTAFPTGGIVLDVNISYFRLRDIVIRSAFTGMKVSNSVAIRAESFDILDAQAVGIECTNSNDFFISNFTISAPNDYYTVTSTVGAFVNDELVTFTNGATGRIVSLLTSTIIKIHIDNKNPVIGETMTGSTSAATCIVSAVDYTHSLGGMRITNKVEALIVSNGDIIGGKYSITTASNVNAAGTRPAYNRFNNVYFDSSDEGGFFDKAVDFTFTGCWFSNRPNNGCVLYNTDGFTFSDTSFINCGSHGLVLSVDAKRTSINGSKFMGNSTLTSGTYSGVSIAAGTSDFVICNSTIGGSLGLGNQKYGVVIAAGSSDRYSVVNNTGGNQNVTAAISDGGTGVNKTVSSNW